MAPGTTAPAPVAPTASPQASTPPEQAARLLRRDLRTLAVFIDVYCRHKHRDALRERTTLKTHDVEAIAGRELYLCEDCRKLVTHAFIKRSRCPMDPKPMCKHCPSHCYHPSYRAKMQEVMRFAGRKSVLSGRLDFLFHLFF